MLLSNKLKTVLLKDIKPYENNIKIHTDEQIERIKKSIEDNKYIQPICIDKNNIIVIGHGRYFALQKINPDMEIEVVDLSDLNDEEIKKLRIQDNKLNESEWNFDNLEKELKKIYIDLESGMDKIVEDLSFDKNFIKDIVLKDKYDDKEDDEIPEIEKNIIKRGDIIELGKHRLMCGDSTTKDDVDRLMNGQKVDMIFTDPPYGINLSCDYTSMKTKMKGLVSNKFEKIKNDDKLFNPLFIFDYFKECKEIFLWGADYYAELIPERNMGCFLVWDKTESGIRTNSTYEKMFGSNFELCWSKIKHKRQIIGCLWKGIFGMGKNDEKKRIHPTQKPIRLCEWFINKFSKNSQLIIDLFLGSGSTLIACEKTGRICYGMEIDEHYCDVIIERYCKYTNNWNIKINDKQLNWSELKQKT